MSEFLRDFTALIESLAEVTLSKLSEPFSIHFLVCSKFASGITFPF